MTAAGPPPAAMGKDPIAIPTDTDQSLVLLPSPKNTGTSSLGTMAQLDVFMPSLNAQNAATNL